MKAAKIIYLVMNVTMILGCAVLAAVAMSNGFNALYLIAPLAAAVIFGVLVLQKTSDELKRLLKVVLSSHVAVIIIVTQAVFVFKVDVGNAVIIIAVAIILIVLMLLALRRMFRLFAGSSLTK